ncbi:hypothetical protein SADUNF_Sadunf12G0036000 [Salix dunnii]|uniref:Uncharacterized protein n=1 Tax=Salix dunnii TaxID=1413687 RepID=A0A835MP75_9ROSI|nr:hypothetical protein SADUNF_Sadunf12G0036000 [Salix dunnii]
MINLNVRELPFRLRGRVEDRVTAAHIQDTGDDLQDEDQDIDQAATPRLPYVLLFYTYRGIHSHGNRVDAEIHGFKNELIGLSAISTG